MIIAAQLDAAEGEQQRGGAGASTSSAAGPRGQPPSSQPPAQTLLGALYGAALDNSAYERFYKRFMHVAQRNLNRMATTLGDLAGAASTGRGGGSSSDKEAGS